MGSKKFSLFPGRSLFSNYGTLIVKYLNGRQVRPSTQTGPLPMLGRERDSLDHVTNEPNWKI